MLRCIVGESSYRHGLALVVLQVCKGGVPMSGGIYLRYLMLQSVRISPAVSALLGGYKWGYVKFNVLTKRLCFNEMDGLCDSDKHQQLHASRGAV